MNDQTRRIIAELLGQEHARACRAAGVARYTLNDYRDRLPGCVPAAMRDCAAAEARASALGAAVMQFTESCRRIDAGTSGAIATNARRRAAGQKETSS
jgi:hypothetical protein